MPTSFEVPQSQVTESGLSLAYLFGDTEQPFETLAIHAMAVNPLEPTVAKPGSKEKVVMLAARYAAGLPLWHDSDRIDHGPGMKSLSEAELH